MTIEQFLSNALNIRDSDIRKELSACGEICHLKKGNILFHQSYEPEFLAFLLHGIMRAFAIDERWGLIC